MADGIRVKVEGQDFGAALREAIRLRGQVPQTQVDITVISPEELQEVEDDEQAR